MSITELFANQPFGIVTSGGTDTTSTAWTVTQNPSAPFPTAQASVSQFHITDGDPTAASEIILVTNVNTGTGVWTVVRGAEGTTPVVHQAGFTVTQVLTAGWLNGVEGSDLPATSAGAVLYGNPAADAAWLAGPTASAKEFLTSTGSAGTANSPAWGTIASADVPTLNQNTTGTAGNVTGIVAVLNGGTGGTTATAYAVITGGTSSTTSFQSVAGLGSSGQALTSNGAGTRPSWQQTFTGLMEPLASPVTFSASPYSAAAGQYVPVDTTSGNVTVNLPASAADKAIVGIKHVIQGGTNAVTWVATGGAVINKTGGGTQGTLPLASQGVITQYAAAGTIWYVYSDDLPLGQLDARYVHDSALPLGVGSGGSGLGSLTTYEIVTGGTASTTAVQQIAIGSSGQVLTSNGAGSLPSFQPNVALVSPMATHGDTIYENAALAPAALPGNTTSTKNFLTSTGGGGTANGPVWGTIATSDVPVLNQNTTGTAGGLSTILAITSGGTGQASQQAALNALAGGTTPSGDYLRANGTNVTLSSLLASRPERQRHHPARRHRGRESAGRDQRAHRYPGPRGVPPVRRHERDTQRPAGWGPDRRCRGPQRGHRRDLGHRLRGCDWRHDSGISAPDGVWGGRLWADPGQPGRRGTSAVGTGFRAVPVHLPVRVDRSDLLPGQLDHPGGVRRRHHRNAGVHGPPKRQCARHRQLRDHDHGRRRVRGAVPVPARLRHHSQQRRHPVRIPFRGIRPPAGVPVHADWAHPGDLVQL